MTILVIGGDGLIGSALVLKLRQSRGHEVIATSRKRQGDFSLDLLSRIPELPDADIAFLCAGIKSKKENNPESWLVNVDGILEAGKQLLQRGTFVVYTSTDAVERTINMYTYQRALVEIGLLAMGDPAIVRVGPVTLESAPNLAESLESIGISRLAGIHHWHD